MRRKEKEITDRTIINDLLNKATVMRIAMVDGSLPYVVPLNFGYRDNYIYFHCAKEGRKVDILKKNNNVCFEIDTDMGLIKGEAACDWGQNYYSVIGVGKAYFIDTLEEKIVALNSIMEHYSGVGSYEFSENQLQRVLIIKIEIEQLTGKCSVK